MADADVFALPSQTENFGMAAAEAACVGLPLALSDQTGAAEWLHPPSTRVVPVGDVEALATAIGELASGSAKAAADEAAPGLRRALAWPEVMRTQMEIYEDVLRRDPGLRVALRQDVVRAVRDGVVGAVGVAGEEELTGR